MKRIYKRGAWLLNDGVLIKGTKDKYGFHPEKGVACDFNTRKIHTNQKNVIWFDSLKNAIDKLKEVKVMCNTLCIAYDKGLAVTKYIIEDVYDILPAQNTPEEESELISAVLANSKITLINGYVQTMCYTTHFQFNLLYTPNLI